MDREAYLLFICPLACTLRAEETGFAGLGSVSAPFEIP